MTSHPPTPRRAEAQRMPRIIETGGGQKEDESEQAGGGVTWTICIFKFEFFFSAPVAAQIFHTLSAFSPAICLSLSEDWALALPDGLVFSVLFLSSIPLVPYSQSIFFFFLSHFFTVSISLCTVYLFFWSIHFSALYLFTSESTEKGFTSSLFIYTYTYTFTYSILGLSVFSSIFFFFFSSTLFLFCLSV